MDELHQHEHETQVVAKSETALAPTIGTKGRDSAGLPFTPGRSVGRFVLFEAVGRGATAVVYRAYDPALRREVALKFLDAGSDEDDETRLLAEAQAMAQLSHPNVVAVYDAMVHRPYVVLAMEYVPGQTLRSWLAAGEAARAPESGGGRSWKQILEVFMQAGTGLAAAHRAGLVHRDFKPANVLVSADGRVLVTDFGIATGRPTPSEHELVRTAPWAVGADTSESELVLGTPRYMAPEQHRGQPVDPRTDQYAFCVALWEALCGAPPFPQSGFEALELAKLCGPPPWPQRVRVPRSLAAAVVRGLATDPDDRWPSLTALLQALAPPSRLARRRSAAGALAVPLIASWLWVWQTERADRCSGAPARLHRIWNDADKAAVLTAFEQTRLVYAGQSAALTIERVEQYTRQWTAQFRAACEATVVEGVRSERDMELQMSCLHRLEVELSSTIQLLRRADGQVVEKAVQVVGKLPLVSRCADIDSLRSELAPPEDAKEAERVEAARVLLAEARAEAQAGRYEPSIELLRAVEESVEESDYLPLRAEFAFLKGSVLDRRADYAAAEESLEEALSLALSLGMGELAAATSASLSSLVGEARARLDEGLRLAQVALPIATALGHRSVEATARTHHGSLLWIQGRYDEAGAEFQRSLELRKQAFGPEHPEVADAHDNLGKVLFSQGHLEEAEAEFRLALRLYQAGLGAEHPDVGLSRNNLAIALHALQRLEEAEVECRAAIASHERVHGPEHPWVAASRSSLGQVLFDQGRDVEAEAELRRSLDIEVQLLGPDHVKVAHARTNLGLALHQRGRHPEAQIELTAALAGYTKAGMKDHPNVAGLLYALGESEAALGDEERGREKLERAWSIASVALPPAMRAEIAFALAKVLWSDARERPRALELAGHAHDDYVAAGAKRQPQVEQVREWIAQRGSPRSLGSGDPRPEP